MRRKSVISCICGLCLAVILISDPVHDATAQSVEDSLVEADSTAPGKFSWSVLPVIYSSPETDWAFGLLPQLVFSVRGSRRPSQVYLALFYTVNKQHGALFNSTIWMNEDRDNLEVEGIFLHWPTMYYGIGSRGIKSTPEDYTEDVTGVRVTEKHMLSGSTFAGLSFSARHQELSNLQEGGDISQKMVPGSEGGWVLGLGPVVGYDSRDHNLYPSKGQMIEVGALNYGGFLGGDYDYVQLFANMRSYHAVGRNQVIAVQAYLSDGGNEIPFWMMEGIGKIVRGFQNTKYVDRTLVAGQIEYRVVPAYRRLGFALFAGAGTVAPSFSDIPNGKLRWAAGAGIRFRLVPDALINIRFDLAFGHDTSEYYLEIGEAF